MSIDHKNYSRKGRPYSHTGLLPRLPCHSFAATLVDDDRRLQEVSEVAQFNIQQGSSNVLTYSLIWVVSLLSSISVWSIVHCSCWLSHGKPQHEQFGQFPSKDLSTNSGVANAECMWPGQNFLNAIFSTCSRVFHSVSSPFRTGRTDRQMADTQNYPMQPRVS